MVTLDDKTQQWWGRVKYLGEKTSDTLIGYMPIFQMLPKTSVCLRYQLYSLEHVE